MLEYFHQQKKQRGVDEALLRLYQPIIWRAFKVIQTKTLTFVHAIKNFCHRVTNSFVLVIFFFTIIILNALYNNKKKSKKKKKNNVGQVYVLSVSYLYTLT